MSRSGLAILYGAAAAFVAGWAALSALLLPSTDIETGIYLVDLVLMMGFVGLVTFVSGIAIWMVGIGLMLPVVGVWAAWEWVRRAKRIYDENESEYDREGYRRLEDGDGRTYYRAWRLGRVYLVGHCDKSWGRTFPVCAWKSASGQLLLCSPSGESLRGRKLKRATRWLDDSELRGLPWAEDWKLDELQRLVYVGDIDEESQPS